MGKTITEFLFFSDRISAQSIELDLEETRHLTDVLRIIPKSRLSVTDGKGSLFLCEFTVRHKKGCTLTILEQKKQPQNYPHLDLFLGVPQRDAFEMALTLLPPLSVAKIVPLLSQHCQKIKWTTQFDKYYPRFYRKIVSAAKQSWNCWFTELAQPAPIVEDLFNEYDLLLVADVQGQSLDSLLPKGQSPERIGCLIGPPEGFSSEEIILFQSKAARLVKLGGKRLRTELAATVLAGTITQTYL